MIILDTLLVKQRSLKAHMKTHEQIRNFKCDVCEKSFSSISALKKHFDGVHERIRKFKCNLCEKTFTTLLIQKAHINAYHLDKVMVCEFCGQKFKYFGSLFEHKKFLKCQKLNLMTRKDC